MNASFGTLPVNKIGNHLYIFLTIALTVYSQLVLRWQMSKLGTPPEAFQDKLYFLLAALFKPWTLSAVAATFLSGLAWMIALTRFELSYAFPFMAFNFVLIMLASAVLFGEAVTTSKVVGNLLIVAGVIFLARSTS